MKVKRKIGISMIIVFFIGLFVFMGEAGGYSIALKTFATAICLTIFIVVAACLIESD